MIRKLSLTTKLILISFLVIGITLFFKFKRLPPQIPLFYSRPEGDQQIADFFWLFLPPFLVLLLVVINNFIGKTFFKDNLFIDKLISYVNLIVIILLTFIFLRIIFLIT